ncbi:MAG: MucB/RseB C-terminal domain-containing protein [Spongiibacteraceae bacterium]
MVMSFVLSAMAWAQGKDSKAAAEGADVVETAGTHQGGTHQNTASGHESTVWLDRLARMDELNFRGVLMYTRGEHHESLRVTHGFYNGELYERLEHLDGERREIIRHGDQLTCIQLGQRLERLLHRHVLKAGLGNLEPYYAISVGGESRIANRRAVALYVKSRDEFRYSYRLALDYETGLLLRIESVNQLGHVLERLQFVDVQIGEPLKKEWLGEAITASVKKAPDPMPIERVVEEAQMAWKPRWLPPGFSLALAPHRAAEQVLTYSDGMTAFSVFLEAATEPLPSREGSAAQGATVAYTRPVQVDGKPYLVLVVGEVPADTARRVASSVEWSDGAVLR